MSIPYIELTKPLGDFSLLCRGCLANSGEMKNMNEWGLIEDFCKLTEIQVNKYENMSVLLCTNCEDNLLRSKNFKLQCQQSDSFLEDLIKTKSFSNPTDQTNHQETQENSVSCVLYENKLVLIILAPDMNAKISLPCPHKCKAKFSKAKFLLTHLTNIHNVPKDFVIQKRYHCTHKDCNYNEKSDKRKFFIDRKYLNQHLNKVHGSKILCHTCKSVFTNNTEFERHISNNCNMNYVCEICHITYKTNDRLIVHLMRKHPDIHKKYKEERKSKRKANKTIMNAKKIRSETDRFSEYNICDSPKRSSATQTLNIEKNIKNDVTLPSWNGKTDLCETKTDEISTQTVFEDLLSIKSQNSEDESLFFSETVSLSDIQTQTFPVEFGLSRCNKETITSETQSPDLSIKETQTCYCLYDSPKLNFKLFDSVSSSPSNISLTSSETQTSQIKSSIKTDVWLSFSSAETQTCFEDGLSKEVL